MKSEFAERLSVSCDAHAQCPPLHKGRLTWVKKAFFAETERNLSVEAIRKWFAGEAWPQRDSVSALARILGVNEVWLAMGDGTRVDSSDRVDINSTYALSVELRPGINVTLSGLPRDLKYAEAKHLANLVLASATADFSPNRVV